MNIIRKISLVLIIFSIFLPAQSTLLEYQADINSLKFDLHLDPVRMKKVINENGGINIVFDEMPVDYNSGKFILPEKEVFIALPAVSNVRLSYKLNKESTINGTPEVSQEIELDKNQNLIYKKAASVNAKLIKNQLVEIEGYQWIGNYYCVRLKINQYHFNLVDKINQIIDLSIELKLEDISKSQRLSENVKNGFIPQNTIQNIDQAVQLDRRQYDKSLSKSEEYSWINFSNDYVKIGTALDDIYRVSKSNLDGLGANLFGIDPRTFKLYLKGEEVPIFVQGESDGTFDSGDFIEFVGIKNPGDPDYREISTGDEEYKEYANRYSDTTIYWLTWNGSNGKRVKINSGGFPSVTDTVLYYYEIAHYEEDRWLDYSISDLVTRQEPFWHTNQTWVWGQQAVGTANRNFTVSDLVTNKTSRAFYKVQDFASNLYTDVHKIGLSINNDTQVFDSASFNKYDQRVISAQFSSNLLQDGTNRLKTISFATDAVVNSVAYDWYEVEYPRYLSAQNNFLKFNISDVTNGSIRAVKVSNFSSPNIRVYKYSGNIELYENEVISGNKVFIIDTLNNNDKYIFKSESGITAPKLYYSRKFENLADNTGESEYLIITHKLFLNKAAEYAEFIEENYPVSVKVFDVERIYDQYNYGFFAPEPIKDFLMDLQDKWSVKPVYLNLIGDATYDYRGNKTKYFGNPVANNFVPSFGEPVSDTWYVTWDSSNAYIPQMIVGRIPVNSISEFDHYFNKHQNYLDLDYDLWNKTYMFISSGDASNPSELTQLKNANDQVVNNFVITPPIGGNVSHLYKTSTTSLGPYTNEELDSLIGLGGLFISYLGHSGTQIWDNGISDVKQLHNDFGKNPLISDFGCSTGKFAEPDIKAFSELFVCDPDGEAIGYLGNASLGFFSTATLLPKIFYGKMLTNDVTMAEAHILAKTDMITNYGMSGSYRVFSLTNTFFGDPIISLKRPHKPDFRIEPNDISFDQAVVEDSDDSVLVHLDLYNYGNFDTTNVSVNVHHTFNGTTFPDKIITAQMPPFKTTLDFYLKTGGQTGQHQLQITVDPENDYEEVYENNNEITYDFYVVNTNLRYISKDILFEKNDGNLKILNPSFSQGTDSIQIEISQNPEFNSSDIQLFKMDTLLTSTGLTGLTDNQRYYWRARVADESKDYGVVNSFIYTQGSTQNYSISDSTGFFNLSKAGVNVTNNKLVISSGNIVYSVIAAGFYDGSYSVVSYNGENVLSDGHLDGFHLVVVDSVTLSIDEIRRFTYYENTSQFAANFISFLNSIENGKFVLFAMSGGEGNGITTELKNKIKEFGSVLIDSVGFRHSWAMIGYRGAVPGTVQEAWSKPYGGSVDVDTTFTLNLERGSFLTKEVGPSSHWGNINLDYSIPGDAVISITPYGIKSDAQTDTLSSVTVDNQHIDISGIDAELYPKLKLDFLMENSSGGESPEISSIDINYNLLSELYTNYQTVNVAYDSVNQGGNNNLDFGIYNVGEASADSFSVTVELVRSNNTSRIILDTLITQLSVSQKMVFSVYLQLDYEDDQYGNMNFRITIDKNNTVSEIFEDNNTFTAPFYVKKDTTTGVADTAILVKLNGQEIYDDFSLPYVSGQPEIEVTLNQLENWYNYSENLLISINGVVYNDSLTAIRTGANEEQYKLQPNLSDGLHTVRVWVDLNDFNRNADYESSFQVENTLKILDVYNYPNPFSGSTYFTFKLTQIPDEVKIKIFTVAGRLIKEFTRSSGQLNFDFNEILWDGRDQDGDLVANGVYLYKVIMKKDDQAEQLVQKLAVVR